MITTTEIARLTGVSQPTVSRVLNGNPSVNPEVAKKVLECAKLHSYQPNMIARGLNGGKTNLLAVIVPDISNPFFADMIREIEQEAENHNYTILIFNTNYSLKKEKKCIGLIQQYRADGLLLAPVHADKEELKDFRGLEIPWMVITNRVEGIDSVFVSHKRAGCLVARHLVDIGSEQFFAIGERHDEKCIGFQEGLAELGVQTEQKLEFFWDKDKERQAQSIVRVAERQKGRTGIFAINDMELLVVMNALLLAGIKIPEKAALVGFDNTFISRRMIPGISSVNQPVEEMGKYAVKEIVKRIQGRKHTMASHKELLAELIIRESSKLSE